MKIKSELYLLTFLSFAVFLLIISALRIALGNIEEYRERESYAYSISLSIARLNHDLRKMVKYKDAKDIQVWLARQQTLTAQINNPPSQSPRQAYLLHAISESNNSVSTLFSLLQAKTGFPLAEVTSPAALHLVDNVYAQIESIREDSHLLSFEASKEISDLISTRIYMLGFLIFAVGVLVVLTSIHLSGKITHSLHTINTGLKKVSSGSFEEKLPQLNDDEFGEVAGHFNSMTEQLRSKTIYLHELQAIVDERTAELRILSETDSLTGIPNRRSYERRMSDELTAAKRHKTSLSLLMIDVDYFKQYNDSYGHDAGDIALQKVATCINNNLPREIDFVARIGGEEFIVLLPSTDLAGARHIADRLVSQVRLENIQHAYPDEDSVLTISIGITSCHNGDSGEVSLINQADQALYQAKENGRNHARVYDGNPPLKNDV
jgi:diguanylate cyclase (GGDEF)-like protein